MWSVGCIFAGEAACSRGALLRPAGPPHTARPAHGFLLDVLSSHACGMLNLHFQQVSGVGVEPLEHIVLLAVPRGGSAKAKPQ